MITFVASPEKSTRSGDTTLDAHRSSPFSSALLQRLRLRQHLLDATDVEERLLGNFVELAVDDGLEALDGLGDRHGLAADAGEHLGHVERLAEEALHLAGTGHGEAVLFGQLVETEDGDDVLQLLVALEDLLHATGDGVVALADDLGLEDRRRRRQRVDRRVDAERGDLAAQLGGGVEEGEGGERRRVGVVVGGHVHGLQRGDRAATGGGDPLLQLAHLVGQRRLVAHGRGHAAEQRRHFGARLHEAEDVVDEQQHVLVLHVAEVLGHRQRRQGDAQADARRLVHLAEHQGGLLEHARLGHLDHEVGALTGALADAGEHGHTAVVLRHTTDHLGDQHGLADAGTTEQADLAARHVRGEQVDDLDAGLEQPPLGSRASKSGRVGGSPTARRRRSRRGRRRAPRPRRSTRARG